MRRLTLLALLLVGCGVPNPTPAPVLVQPTPIPPTGVPAARATFASPFTPTAGPDVASGGLGLRRADWERAHAFGQATVAYRDERVVAIEEPRDRLGRSTDLEITRRRVVATLLPRDAAYVGSETRPDAVVDRFTSATVGPFAVGYALEGGRVVALRVALD